MAEALPSPCQRRDNLAQKYKKRQKIQLADAFCPLEKRFKGHHYSSSILRSKVDGKSLSIYSISYVLYWIIRFVLEYSICCKRRKTENISLSMTLVS